MKKKFWIGFGLVLVISAALLGWQIFGDAEPSYQGKKVGFWYQSLCSGVFGGTPRAANFSSAYEAFHHMGPEMVPYLTRKLRYDRAGYLEKMILLCKKVPFLKSMAKRVVLPTERRCYAAVALRRMGPNATSAIPDLMEACVMDSSRVRLNAMVAIDSILNGKVPDSLTPAELTLVQNRVLSQAARLYPHRAAELGITPAAAK